MKKLIYLIMAVWAFTSCNDSDEAFTVEISAEGFHFTPIMGGALLQYTLPDDPEIIAINVRYQDVYGNPILKTGSNSTDKLTLTGFNESVNNIPAQIIQSLSLLTYSSARWIPRLFVLSIMRKSNPDGTVAH